MNQYSPEASNFQFANQSFKLEVKNRPKCELQSCLRYRHYPSRSISINIEIIGKKSGVRRFVANSKRTLQTKRQKGFI